MRTSGGDRRAKAAGVMLGIGLGGFVDGIVLHQILQWHNMLSNVLPPDTMENMSVNMVWDGVFHAFVWAVTVAGVFFLRSAAADRAPVPPLRQFIGQMILGWGLFNLVEGVIDHQLLAIHYVRQVPNYTAYNLTFLAVGGVALILIGWTLAREGGRAADT